MVDSTGAKSLYNWIVEPDSDGSTFNARKLKQNTEEITNYSDAATMFDAINTDLTNGTGKKGGIVGIRNGTYNISVSVGSAQGIKWGHSSTQTGATVVLVGESRDGTIINNNTAFTTNGARVIGTIANLEIRNLTVDGNSNANTTCVEALDDSHGSPVGFLNAYNCKIIDFGVYGIRMGSEEEWYSAIVEGCEFVNNSSDDMCSTHPREYGRTLGNYFKRTGTGSAITTGEGVQNFEIAYNRVVCDTLASGSISPEPFTVGFSNIEIHHNHVKNGYIKVGNTGASSVPFTNVHIHHNTVETGRIEVKGPTTGYTGVKNIFIDNNRVLYPSLIGIRVDNIGSFCVVDNNYIVDSNIGLTDPVSTEDATAMNLTDITHLLCINNTIVMGVTSPENAWYSPRGISYAGLTHSTIQGNRFFNTTLAPNPNYCNNGSHSGTKNVFSHTS